MNIGQNFYDWFLTQAQPIVLVGLAVIGIYLIYKREFTKLIGFVLVAVIAVGLVFNPFGVKDVLLAVFNRIVGAN